MSTYVFFTSYARPDNADAKLETTLRKLEARVRAKMGADGTVKIAFFDVEDITTGQDWEQRLSGVLRETKVIVCMCSPTYVNSPFCAKEFEVFRRRLAAAAPANVAIVPIIWEPGALPSAILKYQFNDARLPAAYGVTLGLSHFARLSSQSDKLDDAVEVLADVIDQADQGAAGDAWSDPIVFDDLPSFVHNPNRDAYQNVTLTVLHADRAQWKMGGTRRGIGALLDQVAREQQVSIEVIDPDLPTLAARLDAAKAARHLSIVAVGSDDLTTSPWKEYLATIDPGTRSNCAVLVGWPHPERTSPADIQTTLRALLPQSAGTAALPAYFALADEKGAKDVLTQTIVSLQMALMNEDKGRAQQVVSQTLTAGAGSIGLDLAAAPAVSNGGGGTA